MNRNQWKFVCLSGLGTLWAIFRFLWHKGQTILAASDRWVFSFAKHNSTEIQTEIIETVIRPKYASIWALNIPRPWKHNIESSDPQKNSLTNVTVSPYKHWCQHVSSHFSIKKDEIFTEQKHSDPALLTEEVHDSCFPWMFGKSQNGDTEWAQAILVSIICQYPSDTLYLKACQKWVGGGGGMPH